MVNDDTQHYGGESLISAPGVETVCVFPKNIGKGMEYCLIGYNSLNFSSLLNYFRVLVPATSGFLM